MINRQVGEKIYFFLQCLHDEDLKILVAVRISSQWGHQWSNLSTYSFPRIIRTPFVRFYLNYQNRFFFFWKFSKNFDLISRYSWIQIIWWRMKPLFRSLISDSYSTTTKNWVLPLIIFDLVTKRKNSLFHFCWFKVVAQSSWKMWPIYIRCSSCDLTNSNNTAEWHQIWFFFGCESLIR